MKGLLISKAGWETILQKNGVSWFITESDEFIFINLKDLDKKDNIFKFSKSEIEAQISEHSKSGELYKKHPDEMRKAKAFKLAIDKYLQTNTLFL